MSAQDGAKAWGRDPNAPCGCETCNAYRMDVARVRQMKEAGLHLEVLGGGDGEVGRKPCLRPKKVAE